jgi:hypothetical protein
VLPAIDVEYWLAELMPYRSGSLTAPVASVPLDAKAAVGLYALGSYGPTAAGAEAAATTGDVAAAGANVGREAEGSAVVVAFVVALGADVSLSASALAAFG